MHKLNMFRKKHSQYIAESQQSEAAANGANIFNESSDLCVSVFSLLWRLIHCETNRKWYGPYNLRSLIFSLFFFLHIFVDDILVYGRFQQQQNNRKRRRISGLVNLVISLHGHLTAERWALYIILYNKLFEREKTADGLWNVIVLNSFCYRAIQANINGRMMYNKSQKQTPQNNSWIVASQRLYRHRQQGY